MKYPSCDGELVRPGPNMPIGLSMRTQPPGAFAWGKTLYGEGLEVEKLYFRSPRQEDIYIHGIIVVPKGEEPPEKLVSLGLTFWEWDGNREKPTLSPSIATRAANPHPWHGHLKNGRWEARE